MRMYAFIEQYCQDIVDAQRKRAALVDLAEFPHDDVIDDEEGNKIPVVFVDGNAIPVSDFITLDKSDFLSVYKTQGCPEAFDNYVSALTILEGEEALSKIRNMIIRETERLKEDVELITSV